MLNKEPWRVFYSGGSMDWRHRIDLESCQNTKYRHIYTGSVFLFFVPLANLSVAGVKNSSVRIRLTAR